jgi:hypothetical protein
MNYLPGMPAAPAKKLNAEFACATGINFFELACRQ